jgi:hypothetical protein
MVTPLSASTVQKTSTATNCLCQTALNQKLLHEFQKWCNFQVTLKQNGAKTNYVKRDRPVLVIFLQ